MLTKKEKNSDENNTVHRYCADSKNLQARQNLTRAIIVADVDYFYAGPTITIITI